MMRRTEKMCVLDELCSGMSYSAVAVSSMSVNQQHILNKVSLPRNTHKTRLCKDQLTETVVTRTHPVFPLGAAV